ncbi:MAG: enoyl-CoA hydratase/isomerase family protein [Mycobacterium sp.]|nr:enoyl-CoA hydratase/isomerase family protein [Mycobacterium sp.]
MARKSAEGRVLLDVGRDHVAVVTLNRPESLNSLDTEAAEGLQERLEELTARDDIHVVILTGAGRGFCSGADLRWLSMLAHSDSTVQMMRDLSRPVRTIAALPALTIAAVNGPAAGAGWGLAMACDIRIASPAAKFVATFSRMGLGPDYGLAQTLPLAVGRDRALELLLTARVIDAQEAQRIGAVTSIAQDALSEARRLASAVAQVPGRAIRSTKRSLRLAAEADLDTVVDDIEARAQAELLNHPRFAEDARAWISGFAAERGD